MVDQFLKYFWFLGALLPLISYGIYAKVISEKFDKDIVVSATHCIQIMTAALVVTSLLLGVLQLRMGSPIPVVPFASPVANSGIVRASWLISLVCCIVLVIALNYRAKAVSIAVAEVFFGHVVRGEAAVRTFNFMLVFTVAVCLLIAF